MMTFTKIIRGLSNSEKALDTGQKEIINHEGSQMVLSRARGTKNDGHGNLYMRNMAEVLLKLVEVF